jgi:hypothetical protein
MRAQVLSPLPQFVNPGYTAWAEGGGSPLLFVMRCNPQHYYLLHELGHRLGLPHATLYKLSEEAATPTVSATLCPSGVTGCCCGAVAPDERCALGACVAPPPAAGTDHQAAGGRHHGGRL